MSEGGFKDHFSSRAASYAAHRPRYPMAVVDFLASLCATRGTAWDAGCGSGQLSVLLAERFERVIATDASAEQLARAEPHPRVEYRQARAEMSGIADGEIDLAVAAQAAHWFDLSLYYAEVRRVARPGAVIALATYDKILIDDVLDPLIDEFYHGVVGRYWPPERRLVEQGYRTVPFPFEPIPAPAFELVTEWSLADLVGYIDTWSAVAAFEKAQGKTRVEAFQRELERAWGSPETRRSMRWPLAIRLGRVSSPASGIARPKST